MTSHTAFTLLFFLLSGTTACTKTFVHMPASPRFPATVQTPDTPEVQSQAEDFETTVQADRLGASSLRLARRPIALVAIQDNQIDLRQRIIAEMLNSGFRDVVDLSGAGAILAGHRTESRGHQTTLLAPMANLLGVAPVHRAEVLIYIDEVDIGTLRRRLPVHYWVESEDVEAYDAAVARYTATRTERVAELTETLRRYQRDVQEAKDEYEETRPWWQYMLEGELGPDEYAKADRTIRTGRRQISAMPRELRTGAEIAEQVSTRHDVSSVPVAQGHIKARLIDGQTGRILGTITVRSEASNRIVLEALLIAALIDELEA